jgi:hypothetical protein
MHVSCVYPYDRGPHKLARIIYHMVTTGQDYDETICVKNETKNRQRLEARLRKHARELGFQLVAAL